MKRFRVGVAAVVWEQIDAKTLYISNDSVDTALQWEQHLRNSIEALADFHGHAVDADVSAQLGYPVRKVIFERTYLTALFCR